MNKQVETPFLAINTTKAHKRLVEVIEKGYKLHQLLFNEYRNLNQDSSRGAFIDKCNKSIDNWVNNTHSSLLKIYCSPIYAEKFITARGTLIPIQGLGLDFSDKVIRLENKLRILHEYLDSIITLASPRINFKGNFIFQSGNLNKADISR